MDKIVRPEPVEGWKRRSWFDKLTTNGFGDTPLV